METLATRTKSGFPDDHGKQHRVNNAFCDMPVSSITSQSRSPPTMLKTVATHYTVLLLAIPAYQTKVTRNTRKDWRATRRVEYSTLLSNEIS